MRTKLLLVCLAVIAASIHAVAYGNNAYDFKGDNNLYYKINDDGFTVSVIYETDDVIKDSPKYRNGHPNGDIIIPERVTYENITYTVTEIYEETFAYFNSLTSVIIPNTVTTIGGGAFYGDYYATVFWGEEDRLTNVTIGNSVTTIGGSAFAIHNNIKEIKSLIKDPTKVNYGDNIFWMTDMNLCVLKVPKGTVETYRNTYPWSDFVNIVEDEDENNDAITPPESATVEQWYLSNGTTVRQESGSAGYQNDHSQLFRESGVLVAFDGNTVYLNGLGAQMPDDDGPSSLMFKPKQGWIKGTMDGDIITFHPTDDTTLPILTSDNLTYYLTSGSGDIEFYYNATEGSMTANSNVFVIATDNPIPVCCWFNLQLLAEEPQPEIDQVVTPPTDMKTTEWEFIAKEDFEGYGDDVRFPVNIGFDGDDVYIQGFATQLGGEFDKAWVKGKCDGDTYTFATRQYLGENGDTHYYFGGMYGYSGMWVEKGYNELESIVFHRDGNVITANNYSIVVNKNKYEIAPCYIYNDFQIVKTSGDEQGDVNGDGVVSGADGKALYNVLLDGTKPAGDADVNGDGVVSGADVTALYNLLLN